MDPLDILEERLCYIAMGIFGGIIVVEMAYFAVSFLFALRIFQHGSGHIW